MASLFSPYLLAVVISLSTLFLSTSAAYTVLPAPPCSGDRGSDSFFVSNSIKPFICLGAHKEIKFNLTCTSTPVTAAAFKASLGQLQGEADQALAPVAVLPDPAPEVLTACFPPSPDGAQYLSASSTTESTGPTHSTSLTTNLTSSLTDPISPTDLPERPDNTRKRRTRRQAPFGVVVDPEAPCTEVNVRQLADTEQSVFATPGSPYHVLLPQGAKHFTPKIWADLLDTLAQLPGADRDGATGGNGGPLQCRIDVFEGNGLRFGEGCITPVPQEKLYDSSHANCPVARVE